MTEQEIKEGNDLIAIFIGVDIEFSPTQYRDSKSNMRPYIDHRSKSDGLEFHSNWKWLMLVIEFIEVKGYNVKIDTNYTSISAYNDIALIFGDIKIINTFNAVVKFVKWYNIQKQ